MDTQFNGGDLKSLEHLGSRCCRRAQRETTNQFGDSQVSVLVSSADPGQDRMLPDILVYGVGLHQMTDVIGHFGSMRIGHCGGEDSFNGPGAEDSFMDVPFYGHRPKEK